MNSENKSKIEYIQYKCYKCRKNFPFAEMTKVLEKFENGCIKITYLCKKCREEEKEKINGKVN